MAHVSEQNHFNCAANVLIYNTKLKLKHTFNLLLDVVTTIIALQIFHAEIAPQALYLKLLEIFTVYAFQINEQL